MGLGGFSEKDINITNGGMDSWLPAMLMNSGKSGGFGGDNSILFLFFILFACGDKLGLGGRAAVASTTAAEIGIANAGVIDSIKSAIAASCGTMVSSMEKTVSSIIESMNNKFSEQTANLTNQITLSNAKTTEGFVRVENGLQLMNTLNQTSFATLNRSFADLNLTNCQNQNALLNAINCSSQSIKDSQNAGFSALSAQNAQLMNSIVQTNCNINDKFKDLSCQLNNSTRDIIQSQKDIASAQAAADAARREVDYRDRIAKLEANCEHHHRRENESNNISINNQIAVLSNNINTLLNAISSRPSNGNGNS